MKRRFIDWLFNWLYAPLERLFLYLDGRAVTQVRIKAVQKAHTPTKARRISKARAAMSHHCDIPPWERTAGGSWYCPKCRTWRTYVLLPKVGSERAAEPHYVPRIRGRHNGHLLHVSGRLVDTGKLLVPGRG